MGRGPQPPAGALCPGAPHPMFPVTLSSGPLASLGSHKPQIGELCPPTASGEGESPGTDAPRSPAQAWWEGEPRDKDTSPLGAPGGAEGVT